MEKVDVEQDKLFGVPSKFIDQCMEKFDDPEIDLLQEECAELIQACSKLRRYKKCDDVRTRIKYRDNLIEELAHVAMSSASVARRYKITQEDLDAEVEIKRLKHNFEKG